MMFVTGPAFAGKRSWVRAQMGWDESELARRAAWDVQQLVGGQADGVANSRGPASGGPAREPEDLVRLADELATHEVVIACELGGGVVPVDATQRAQREAAGRLACLLAERADVVVRICCGLPQVLKGTLPPREEGLT